SLSPLPRSLPPPPPPCSPLPLHDALPISGSAGREPHRHVRVAAHVRRVDADELRLVHDVVGHPRERLLERDAAFEPRERRAEARSEEHTSELQSPDHLVCRLLLEKKKTAA